MTTKPKQKLCWNCEGNVSFQEENCPYCGVYLSPTSSDGSDQNEHYLTPPYKLAPSQENDDVPASPYTPSSELPKDPVQEEKSPHQEAPQRFPRGTNQTHVMTSMVFLLSGSVFALFGLVLLLFSSPEGLVLRWDSSYWFIYFLVGLPLLVFGWKYLQSIDEEDDS